MLTLKQGYVYLLPFLTLSLRDANGVQNCSSHRDCSDNYYCCTVSLIPLWKICTEHCVYKLCRTNQDCGSDRECCSSLKLCTLSKKDCGCRKNNVCKRMDLHCCQISHEESVCKAACIDETCNEDENCAPGECCSRSNRCTKDQHTCLETCNTNAHCMNPIRPYCCGHRYQRRYCSNTCLDWQCRSDSDCGDPQQCCVNNFCKNSECTHELSSWKIIITIASVVVFLIICTTVIVSCYRKRIGRCVFLQRRTQEEIIELQPNLPHVYEPTQNTPPPPYSPVDQPFPLSQNQEFPPLYTSQPQADIQPT